MDSHGKQDALKKPFFTRAYLVADGTAFGVQSSEESGLRLKLIPRTSPYFPGRLELRFSVRYEGNCSPQGEQLQIFLTAKNARNIYYSSLTFETDNIQLSLTNKNQLLACIHNKAQKSLFSVEFDYDPSNPHAVGFFTSKKYGGQQKAVDLLREVFLRHGRFQLLAEAPDSKDQLMPLIREIYFKNSQQLKKWFAIQEKDSLSNMVIDGKRCLLNHGGIVNLGLPCMMSFADKDEYSTVMAFANLREFKKLKNDVKTQMKKQWEIRVFPLPGCGDRCYFALLRQKTEELGLVADEVEERDNKSSALYLPHGEQLKIDFENMDFETLDFETMDFDKFAIWTATRVDFVPSAPSKDLQLLLKRPWDQKEQKYAKDVRSNPLSPYTAATNFKDAIKDVENATPTPVSVGLAVRRKPFIRKLKALNNLRLGQGMLESKDEAWQILLGNQPGNLPRQNLYSGVDDLLLEKTILTEEQKSAIRMMETIPGGIMLISGPSNSGKTSTMLHSVLPLLANERPDGLRHQVLITSSSADSLNLIASRLHQLVQEQFPNQQKRIVLCHSPSEVVQSTLDQADCNEDTGELPLADQFGPHDVLSGVPLNLLLRDLNELKGSQNYELSLPYWILKWGRNEFIRSKRFKRLFDLYECEDITEDGMDALKIMMIEVQSAVLKNADVVISTPLVAGDYRIREDFDPDTVYVDEASRIGESEMWPLFAYYNPKVRILLGDDMFTTQLSPAKVAGNPLAPQLELPFFTRMLRCGVQTATLKVQHGMHSDIAKMISNVFYEDQLKEPQPLNSEDAAVADRIRSFNSRQFKKSNVVFVDVTESNAVRLEPTMTMMNKRNIDITAELVTALVNEQVASAKEISIVTAYHGQYLGHLETFQKDEKLREVSIDRIDMRSSIDAKITIVDLTVSNEIGYMRQSYRLNSLLSRGRCGLYIIGNRRGILKALRERDIRHITRLMNCVSEEVIRKRKRHGGGNRSSKQKKRVEIENM